MNFAIIAEGRADLAVLQNILKGALDIDGSEVEFIFPEYSYDNTDMAKMSEDQFGSWTLVKKRLETEQQRLAGFFAIDEPRFLIIQIDTDVRAEYDVTQPISVSTAADILELRANVIAKLQEWLGDFEHADKALYAVAHTTIDSWILTIYTDNTETGKMNNPKAKLEAALNKEYEGKEGKKLFSKNTFDFYKAISDDFRKDKNLKIYIPRNRSFAAFYADLKGLQEGS